VTPSCNALQHPATHCNTLQHTATARRRTRTHTPKFWLHTSRVLSHLERGGTPAQEPTAVQPTLCAQCSATRGRVQQLLLALFRLVYCSVLQCVAASALQLGVFLYVFYCTWHACTPQRRGECSNFSWRSSA